MGLTRHRVLGAGFALPGLWGSWDQLCLGRVNAVGAGIGTRVERDRPKVCVPVTPLWKD